MLLCFVRMGKLEEQRVGDDPEAEESSENEANEEEDSDEVPEDDFETQDVDSNNEENSEEEDLSDADDTDNASVGDIDNEESDDGGGNVEDNDESSEGEAGNEESEDDEGNTGWADAMAKVLAMGKNSDKPVSVLSKAKKDNERKRKVPSEKKTGEDSDSDQEEEDHVRNLEPLAVRKARKRELDSIGRKMPNVLERNAEKALARIATRGVVQLFNAVRDHQKDMKTKLKEAGGSFRKQEKVYKNMDKSSFVQMLTGKPISQSSEPPSKKSKTEVKDEEDAAEDPSAPSWNILRDDYMLGAKMKDWDKQSDEEQ